MKIQLIFLFLILFSSFAYSEEIIEVDYGAKFNDAAQTILEMSLDGFQTQRINDTLKAAIQIYEGQQSRAKAQRDYTIIDTYLDEIEELKEKGYIARDEVTFVYDLYDSIAEENPAINLSEADLTIEEMNFEFNSERYDEAFDLAKEAYSRLIEIEGQQTALNLAYKTTTKTLKAFFVDNWMIILIVLAVATIFYFIIKNRLGYFLIKRKIRNLIKERDSLEALIKKTQVDYFEHGDMAESTYQIRIKKFSELMRDINRQIPLLKEALARKRHGKTFDADELTQTKGRKKHQQLKAPIKERKVEVKLVNDKNSKDNKKKNNKNKDNKKKDSKNKKDKKK
jgi:hypothetical protein